MFKIGINSAPRITPAEVTETQETPVQQNLEQQTIPETKPLSASNTSIRAEAMFSQVAMRSQLLQQLARNESTNTNSASLKQIKPVELQPLTQAEAQQQIENQPTYIKPLDADEASKIAFLPKTLYTGDGDDKVEIKVDQDEMVHVNVNGKEAWSGTRKQFEALTIDTGRGNDVVINEVSGSKIQTGDGNDFVQLFGLFNQVDTGNGDDRVESWGSYNNISTGSGNDEVSIDVIDPLFGRETGEFNQVNTGSGDDKVRIEGDYNTVQTEDGNDLVELGSKADANDIDTGGQEQDKVIKTWE
jgi:hypothetical protein